MNALERQAQRNGFSVFQQARLNTMRRIAQAGRIADRADDLLAEYHGEIIPRERDEFDAFNDMLDGRRR